jgi:hypothetical protein
MIDYLNLTDRHTFFSVSTASIRFFAISFWTYTDDRAMLGINVLNVLSTNIVRSCLARVVWQQKFNNIDSSAVIGACSARCYLCADVCILTLFLSRIVTDTSYYYVRVPPILISRFILNLRQIDEDSGSLHHNFNGDSTAQKSTIRFNVNAIVGNMGESLDFDAQSYDYDLEGAGDVNAAAPSSSFTASSDVHSVHHTGSVSRIEASSGWHCDIHVRIVLSHHRR